MCVGWLFGQGHEGEHRQLSLNRRESTRGRVEEDTIYESSLVNWTPRLSYYVPYVPKLEVFIPTALTVKWTQVFPRNENRNEGTFACSPGTKNRNKGTFAETTLSETTLSETQFLVNNSWLD